MCESTNPNAAVKVGNKIRIVNNLSSTYSGVSDYTNGDVMIVRSVYCSGNVLASPVAQRCGTNNARHFLVRFEFEVIE